MPGRRSDAAFYSSLCPEVQRLRLNGSLKLVLQIVWFAALLAAKGALRHRLDFNGERGFRRNRCLLRVVTVPACLVKPFGGFFLSVAL